MDITAISTNTYKLKGKKGVVTAEVGKGVEIVGSGSKAVFPITGPGEYEVEGISVFAYPAGESLACLIQVEEVRVLVLGGVIAENVIEEMDTVDVVILGTENMASKTLVELVGKIEPSYIIPAGEAGAVAAFVKDFEHTSRESEKLSLSKATMAAEVTEVVILSK